MKAVQVSRFGGPEVLEVVDLDAPHAGPGQVLVDVTAAGVNYADTHATEDTYLRPQRLPFVPGAAVAARALGDASVGEAQTALLGRSFGYPDSSFAPRTVVFGVPEGISDAEA